MNNDIVYIRMTNGDEIFAHLHGEEEGKLLLSDVLCMETIQTETDAKYLFMARYTPYSEIDSMQLDKNMVVFCNEASDIVKRHYKISLDYAKRISDRRFLAGIADASHFLQEIVEKELIRAEDPFEDAMGTVLGLVDPETPTKH